MQTLQVNKCVFRYCQSNVRWPLPASDYCQARGNQVVVHSSDYETVLGSSRKLGRPTEHFSLTAVKNAFVGQHSNFGSPHVIEKRSNVNGALELIPFEAALKPLGSPVKGVP